MGDLDLYTRVTRDGFLDVRMPISTLAGNDPPCSHSVQEGRDEPEARVPALQTLMPVFQQKRWRPDPPTRSNSFGTACNPESPALTNLKRTCNLPLDCSYLSRTPKVGQVQPSRPPPPPTTTTKFRSLIPDKVSVWRGKREPGGPIRHDWSGTQR